MHLRCYLILIAGLLSGCITKNDAKAIDISDREHVNLLCQSCVLRVDSVRQKYALTILGSSQAIPVSMAQVNSLILMQNIDYSALIQSEINSISARVAKLEHELTIPFFANNKSFKDEILRNQERMAYLRSTIGRTTAYLTVAKFCNPTKGYGFSAWVDSRTGNARVQQDCLSHEKIIPWTEPVVIFSEVPLRNVEASVSIAE